MPLVPLKAAASGFSDPQFIVDGEWEWVAVESNRALRQGMFVAQVVGKSMEPLILDGSYCLFVAPVTGSRKGRDVLVALRNGNDPETGERYTVKRYQSEKVHAKDGAWRHVRVELQPLNRSFEPITLTCDDESQVYVIAEFLAVLA